MNDRKVKVLLFIDQHDRQAYFKGRATFTYTISLVPPAVLRDAKGYAVYSMDEYERGPLILDSVVKRYPSHSNPFPSYIDSVTNMFEVHPMYGHLVDAMSQVDPADRLTIRLGYTATNGFSLPSPEALRGYTIVQGHHRVNS